MSSLKSCVILDDDDEENFVKATDLALTFDQADFSIDSYPVNNKRYPLIGKAFLRRKGKATLVNNDEEDVEDIGDVGGTPNSSIANLDSEHSLSMLFLLDRIASATL